MIRMGCSCAPWKGTRGEGGDLNRGSAWSRNRRAGRVRNPPGRRSVVMVMRNVAIAVAMVALLIGCAGTHWSAATSPVPKTVPWLPLPPDLNPLPEPSPQPVPVPTGTPMCSAADLEGAVIGSNGAGGHVLTTFAFARRGQVACELDGTPSVTLLDASGRPLPFSIRAPFFPNDVSGPALVVPGPNPVPYEGLTYGQARLTIDWNSQPETCPPNAPLMSPHPRYTPPTHIP